MQDKDEKTAVPPTNVSVRIGGTSKKGARLAHVVIDGDEQQPQPLSDFSAAIKKRFGDNPQQGQELVCEPTAEPRPSTIRPRSGALVRDAGTPSRRSTRRPGHARDKTLTRYDSNGEGLIFDPEHDRRGNPITVESLKVTDRFLAARPGSVFEASGSDMKLRRYAPDVADGLRGKPDINENPYNFAPWFGTKPKEAQQPNDKAAHHIDQPDRLSGSICVTFTAHTPIFVPVGELKETESDAEDGPRHTAGESQKPKEFFHCWNGSSERYAIPGASVKGAVRSLFEALTNSRAGITDKTTLDPPPLYRRRSFRLFLIKSVPTENSPCGEVEECDYGLYENAYSRNHRTKELPAPENGNAVDERPFAANLFWVEPFARSAGRSHGHTHGWKTIRYRPLGEKLMLHLRTVQRFCSMKGHPHLRDHGGRDGTAADASRCFYGPPGRRATPHAPDYSSIERRLFYLKEGDLIFGIPESGTNRLHCFGRNVNFLWPAETSALHLMGNFSSRDPGRSQLQGSDPAEATFGFAGTHGDASHPFRGRVRFGTFWGPEKPEKENRPCMHLMPLTAPSGTKAKSRPLYLEPDNNGNAADYYGKTKLRGRKFYWHQQGKNGDVPVAHRLDRLRKGVPSSWPPKISKQKPPLIKPLPAGTTFVGKVHFDNLTSEELGALLVSLQPDLAFDHGDGGERRFGIKIGKGKPRGLGSVTASVKLRISESAANRYRSLDAPVSALAQPVPYIEAYKIWMDRTGKWDDLDLAKALRALLLLPNGTSARVYPPHFTMYGWLPGANDPWGKPSGDPPRAMKRAQDP